MSHWRRLPMIVERVVTSLRMTSPGHLTAAAPVDGLRLKRWTEPVKTLREMHDAIATPHRWPSLAWTPDEWERRVADQRVAWLAVVCEDITVGVVEIEAQPPDKVEITIF